MVGTDGVGRARLLAAGAKYRRIHAVLRHERALTSETLALIARGLGCAVASLRLEAGTLSPAERDRLDGRSMMIVDLLATDPLLSLDERETLMRLYRQFAGRRRRAVAGRRQDGNGGPDRRS
ncbi:MAG: hypothetical protein ACRD0K_21720 [Egibacteraceae bacterium]